MNRGGHRAGRGCSLCEMHWAPQLARWNDTRGKVRAEMAGRSEAPWVPGFRRHSLAGPCKCHQVGPTVSSRHRARLCPHLGRALTVPSRAGELTLGGFLRAGQHTDSFLSLNVPISTSLGDNVSSSPPFCTPGSERLRRWPIASELVWGTARASP